MVHNGYIRQFTKGEVRIIRASHGVLEGNGIRHIVARRDRPVYVISFVNDDRLFSRLLSGLCDGIVEVKTTAGNTKPAKNRVILQFWNYIHRV